MIIPDQRSDGHWNVGGEPDADIDGGGSDSMLSERSSRSSTSSSQASYSYTYNDDSAPVAAEASPPTPPHPLKFAAVSNRGCHHHHSDDNDPPPTMLTISFSSNNSSGCDSYNILADKEDADHSNNNGSNKDHVVRGHYNNHNDDDDDDDGNISPSSISSGRSLSMSSLEQPIGNHNSDGATGNVDDMGNNGLPTVPFSQRHQRGSMPQSPHSLVGFPLDHHHDDGDRMTTGGDRNTTVQLGGGVHQHQHHHHRYENDYHGPSYRNRAKRRLEELEHRASSLFPPPQQHHQNEKQQQTTSHHHHHHIKIKTTYPLVPRVFLMICASMIVIVSLLHDQLDNNSALYYYEDGTGAGTTDAAAVSTRTYFRSHDREEVVDFPLVVARAASHHDDTEMESYTVHGEKTDISDNNSNHNHNSPGDTKVVDSVVSAARQTVKNNHERRRNNKRVDLPKFYFPKQSTSTETDAEMGNNSGLRHGGKNVRSNLAMARSMNNPRPIFEGYDTQPRTDNNIHNNMAKFYFDDRTGQQAASNIYKQQQQQYHHHGHRRHSQSLRHKFLSFVAWVATVTLLSLVIDTGWREYRQSRIQEEEQRRL